MKGSKKGILLSFLLKLVMGIALVVAAAMIGKSLFRLSDQALESFNDLTKKIQGLQDGELESLSLRLDEDTAIIGIMKQFSYVKFQRPSDSEPLYFERPSKCTDDKACLCLCRGGIEVIAPINADRSLLCDQNTIYCKPLEAIDFIDGIDRQMFTRIDQHDIFSGPKEYKFSGGFIFKRDTGLDLPGTKTRLTPIYVERKGDKIGVCFTGDCI